MVVSAIEPDRITYKLYSLFWMPGDNGSQRAIAVSEWVGKHLVTLYTVMLGVIIWQLWLLLSFLIVWVTLWKPKDRQHGSIRLSAGILNSNSLTRAATEIYDSISRSKKTTYWLPLLWSILVFLALSGTYLLPIFITPFLVLGHAAPVHSSQIFVPLPFNEQDPTHVMKVAFLNSPAALRAAGSALVVNETIRDRVHLGPVETLQTLPDGKSIVQVTYQYEISALDLGIQRYSSLHLTVEGSCRSDNGYYQSSATVNGIDLDSYSLGQFQNGAPERNVSFNDGAPPLAYFYPAQPDLQPDFLNTSYLVLFSTVGRRSPTEGVDPFYFTGSNNSNPQDLYTVLPQRPVLVCWQKDVWSYKGRQYAIAYLNETDLPPGLYRILLNFFTSPKIVALANLLGTATLQSATTSLGETFDAGAASFRDDLFRLVLSSFISSVNTLTDTTMHSQGDDFSSIDTTSVPNFISLNDLESAAGFVLYSNNVWALSLPVVVAVPAVLGVWLGVVYILTNWSVFPWIISSTLQASSLLQHLDEEMGKKKGPGGEPSDPPTSGVNNGASQDEEGHPEHELVCIYPAKREDKKGFSWKTK